MPITIQKLTEKFNLSMHGKVLWNNRIPETGPGIYIISTSNDLNQNFGAIQIPAFDSMFIESWARTSTDLKLNVSDRPSVSEIINELEKRWHPNENILYIGKATGKKGLDSRIKQFYDHQVGYSSPHAGGSWIKLLKNHPKLYIHYSKCPNPENVEFQLLLYFAEILSGKSYLEMNNIGKYLPFANLLLDLNKKHNFEKMYTRK